jgi:hypothetical protein
MGVFENFCSGIFRNKVTFQLASDSSLSSSIGLFLTQVASFQETTSIMDPATGIPTPSTNTWREPGIAKLTINYADS